MATAPPPPGGPTPPPAARSPQATGRRAVCRRIGQSEVARQLGLTRQAVNTWRGEGGPLVPTRRATWLPLAAVVANGLLVGASLEQSIKQLPARHRICPAAFAAYSQAADLRNGIPWYATLRRGPPR